MWMWELDCKESWAPKNWCFWTVVFEKILKSPLDCKEIQPAHSKGNQSWIFFGRTDAEAEAQILWPPDVKNWFIGKDSDAGNDWKQEEKGMTEDEMVGRHINTLTRTWVWVSFGSWWWTGEPYMLQFMGSQRVGNYWATKLNWTEGEKSAAISSVQSFHRVLLCNPMDWSTPASLSITNSRSLLKLMSTQSVMSSN